MFTNSAQLLAALAPQRLDMNDLGPLKGLLSARNKCEYEHGLLPQAPSRENGERYLEKAREIVGRVSGGTEVLGRMLLDHRFPGLATGDGPED